MRVTGALGSADPSHAAQRLASAHCPAEPPTFQPLPRQHIIIIIIAAAIIIGDLHRRRRWEVGGEWWGGCWPRSGAATAEGRRKSDFVCVCG